MARTSNPDWGAWVNTGGDMTGIHDSVCDAQQSVATDKSTDLAVTTKSRQEHLHYGTSSLGRMHIRSCGLACNRSNA
jgi:hypothetical protein